MYRTTQIRIEQEHPLSDWCHGMCRGNNDMYNSALYVLRNVLTALDKKPKDRHEKEQEVLDKIHAALPEMNRRRGKNKPPFALPGEDDWHALEYAFLDAYFKVVKHPAYYAKGFTTQSAQNAIRQACDDMDSFWKGLVAWKACPSAFTGKPSLPRYKHKGGISTATITNQDAYITRVWEHGRQAYELKLPKLDLRTPVNNDPNKEFDTPPCMGSSKNRLRLGNHEPSGDLFQVEIVPKHNEYVLSLTFDDGVDEDEMVTKVDAIVPTRIAWIDPGVNRLVAAVTNCGGECLLISGGPLKSVNQWYNKEFARIQSEETKGGEVGEDGKKTSRKFVMTDEAHRLLRYRDAYVDDFLYKAVARVIGWCVENRIDTLGMNFNSDWKNDCKMRHESKQMFFEVPFARFRDILAFRCVEAGIKFLTVEESYTSQASFLDDDPIPTFGCDDARGWRSSGRRVKRGLFRSSDGSLIHADLNGAANGMRKAFPDAFERGDAVRPDFSRVCFLKHPDAWLALANRMEQIEGNDYSHASKSRLKRERRKAGKWDVGILEAHGSKRLYVVQSDRAS